MCCKFTLGFRGFRLKDGFKVILRFTVWGNRV